MSKDFLARYYQKNKEKTKKSPVKVIKILLKKKKTKSKNKVAKIISQKIKSKGFLSIKKILRNAKK